MREPLWLAAATAATAVAFALYARVEWPWFALGWVGLVPWLAALDRRTSLAGAFGAGLLMCEAFTLAVFAWFVAAIQNYTGAPWALALLVLLLLAPILQPQFIAFALARHLARRRGARWWVTALAGAGIYVGSEWALPKLFADTLGHGFYASALMRQAADLAGAPGLTLVLIVANEAVLAALRAAAARRLAGIRPAVGPAACVAALVCALLGYGALRVRQFDGHAGDGVVTAGLVQADFSQYGRLAAELGTYEAVRRILDAHFALSAEVLRQPAVDLLLWPETVYPTTFGAPKSADGAAFDREIGGFVAQARVPLVFGAYDIEDGEEFNAAVLLEPETDGRVRFDAYRKATLFPFTERVPALLDSDLVRGWLPWLGTWRPPGDGARVFSLALAGGRTIRVAPLICYDAVDPNRAIGAAREGAELIVTLSNDSWFAAGQGPNLHLVVSAFRSLETRRPQLRVTNTGVSAAISATGELVGTIGVHERAALVAAVAPVRHARTLMLAWGDWFGPAALAGGLALLAACCIPLPPGPPGEAR